MLAALRAAGLFGVRFDLARLEGPLAALGSPERQLGQVVHVGGTNGKGSTAALIAAALEASGLRVGLYSSPHLSRFTERIRIAGREVLPDALGATYARVRSSLDGLTYFEQATLLAFVTFAEARLDATVLEVGMGGRLDATNVVASTVAAVTGVALDHEEMLGADVAAIAREKAGIFRAGRPAVIGASGDAAATAVLVAEARARGARVVWPPARAPHGGALALVGEHQERNAAVAWAVLDELTAETGGRVAVSDEARRRGFAAATWPGRFEEVVPRVWLDGAHNPDGARALAAAVAALGARRVVAVCGVSSDKDVPGILAPMLDVVTTLYATSAPSARALEAAALAGVAARVAAGRAAVLCEPDPFVAVEQARRDAGDGVVVVFGSLFLVGPVRARLLGECEDQLTVTDPAR